VLLQVMQMCMAQLSDAINIEQMIRNIPCCYAANVAAGNADACGSFKDCYTAIFKKYSAGALC
jgi:hypothetical protein